MKSHHHGVVVVANVVKVIKRFGFVIVLGSLAIPAMGQWTTSGNDIYNSNTGNVGVGTTSPQFKFHLASQFMAVEFFNTGSSGGVIFLKHTRGTSGAPASLAANDYAGSFLFLGYHSGAGGAASAGRVDSQITSVGASTFDAALIFSPASTAQGGNFEAMRITPAGNVGIGTPNPSALLDVAGSVNVASNITVAGNIAAKYQDFAEWVPTSAVMKSGTVVVLDRHRPNTVIPSWQEYDPAVAGVVSANPGLVLGEKSSSKVQIATAGRVRLRADATRHPIMIGDLLVTSSKPGLAMYSEPVEIRGRKFHLPGTVIGKALEPLPSGEGEILVLLSLQ